MKANGVSLIIPSSKPAALANLIDNGLRMQVPKPEEVIIIDSSSSDGSTDGLSAGRLDDEYTVYSIPNAEFDHGGTRNLGARLSSGEILVFMTDDAIPTDEHCLENLVAPLISEGVAATYARQIPNDDANPLERFLRNFNYPPTSRTKGLMDVQELGYKTFFFSNACSAVKADAFWEVGGFPERVIIGEDQHLCAKLLRAGYKVKYAAEARVYHSHNYNLRQQFKRYFDMGASMAQARNLMEGARTGRDGLRFVVGQARYVVQAGDYTSLFKVLADAAAKAIAFSLGKRERYIPPLIKQHLSTLPSRWKH